MGEAIGGVLPLAVGVALSPIPIIAVVLMLATPRGRINGPAFVLGWIIGLGVAGGVILAISGAADASNQGSPADWVTYLKLGLGIVLILVAARTWRGRPKPGEEASFPAWMKAVDQFTPAKSAAIAFALSAINPKNLLITAAAAAAIAQTGISTGNQIGALAVFVLVASLGPGLPVAIYFVMGDKAKGILDDLKAWMARSNVAIMTVICLIIAAKLIGDAIGNL
ncbi:MAG: GAP family protein [Solirubrobacterales bacterium]